MDMGESHKRAVVQEKTNDKSKVDEALKTLMCTVKTWDRHRRGDEILSPLEEHPEVYPSIVIREFKKSSRHGQRWFAGMMGCLKEFVPVAEQLLEIVLSPEIYLEVKKELTTLLSERGYPIDGSTVNAINKSHELSLALISELKNKGELENSKEKILEIYSLPETLSKSLVREVVREIEGQSLPLVRDILNEGESSLAAYLLELLASPSCGELHELLLEAAQDKRQKALQKLAKKALYRLRASGVKIEMPEVAHSPILKAPEYKLYRASAGFIDGEGARALWLARTKAFGGLHVMNFVVNDRKGITDCLLFEASKKRYEEITGRLTPEYLMVDLDPEYCHYLVEEAAKLNPKTNTALPEDYLEAQQLLGKPGKTFERPIIYSYLQEGEAYPNPMLLQATDELFELEEFQGWFMPPNEVETYNFKLQEAIESRLILSTQSQIERIENIVNTAADELLEGELKKIYRRRLEENAYILYKRGQQTEARMALVAALALEDISISPRRHPFFFTLVKRSLQVAGQESSDHLITPHSDRTRILHKGD